MSIFDEPEVANKKRSLPPAAPCPRCGEGHRGTGSTCCQCRYTGDAVAAQAERKKRNARLLPEWHAVAAALLDEVAARSKSKDCEWRTEHRVCAECLEVYPVFWKPNPYGGEELVAPRDNKLVLCGDCDCARQLLIEFGRRKRRAAEALAARETEAF